MFLPIILIIIGILIILENAGIVTGDFWGYVLGAVIVLAGLCFLKCKGKGHSGWWCCKGEKGKEE